MKPVSEKMGIRADDVCIFIDAPAGVIDSIQLPKGVITRKRLSGKFDCILVFVTRQSEQERVFQQLKSHLSIEGKLWVSWPKNRQLDTDLTLPLVIKTGYSFGMVESTCLSIDATWSAIKFTHPKKGKIYRNSHAELRSVTTQR